MTIQNTIVIEKQDATKKHNCERPKVKTKLIIISVGFAALVFVTALIGYLSQQGLNSMDPSAELLSDFLDPYELRRPSTSKMHVFEKAAVCTDALDCSKVSSQILMKNGSAVDAAIAAMFCNGLLNQQSIGIGGGCFMTVYIKEERKTYAVIAREKAPAAATVNMFTKSANSSKAGPLAPAVPGEVRGMWAAHKRWGKLPWSSLIEPTLEVCNSGFPMSNVTYDAVKLMTPIIKNDYHLKKMYYDSTTGQVHTPRTILKPIKAHCNTLRRIAMYGGDELYNGSLAMDFLKDLRNVGSIITAEDLANYSPKITDAIAVPLSDGNTLYAPPPPSSGVVLASILNILSGYKFNASSINSTENTILTYHRILEAFKYSYAIRTRLGDADFLDLKELVRKATSPEYGEEIRQRINDNMTSNNTDSYGVSEFFQPDAGTSHISVVAPNGDAVSVTSSINYYYGAGFTTLKTGILMNNVMDDFSSPGVTSYYGLKPSPSNFIVPGKRPQSSICPSIVVDGNGNVKLVTGGSGGTMITTSVALVMIRKLWFGETIKEAVDAPRIHHQIFPDMNAKFQYGITEDLVNGLHAKGHGMIEYRIRGSAVCALYKNTTAIYGNADYRKGGGVAGMD